MSSIDLIPADTTLTGVRPSSLRSALTSIAAAANVATITLCRETTEINRFLVEPSVLVRCWLGGRKGIQPVIKPEWWVAGVVICLERDAVAYGPYGGLIQVTS